MKPTVEDTVFFGKVVTVSAPAQIRQLDVIPASHRLHDPSHCGPSGLLFRN